MDRLMVTKLDIIDRQKNKKEGGGFVDKCLIQINALLSSISAFHWFWLLLIIIIIFNVTISESSASSISNNNGGGGGDLASSSTNSQQRNGPRFLIEPPIRVHFLNETGAVIQCKITGQQPLRIWWSLSDGTIVTDINGLRTIRPNGDLVLSPFSSTLFRQDVHSAIYRCMATNSIGTIRSRDCEIRAVIPQPYNVQVYGEYAIKGNTGHLKCQIPAFVREYVHVIAWLKEDTILATHLSPKDSRYVILDNGDLLIRNSSRSDNGYYRCQTRHELSQETVLSSIEGHFIVNDVISGVSPRITSQSPIKTQLGHSAQLLCVTKAWPQATVRWFQASESGLITPIRPSTNVQIFDSFVDIRHVTEQHSGNWICVANNSLGEERAYIELYVTRPIQVNMSPDYLVADMTSTATFVCNVSQGQPISILWVKDGQPIMMAGSIGSAANQASNNLGYVTSGGGEGRIRLIEPHVLNIRSVVREDAGCYQCIVQADDHSIQAIGELKLGDSPPVFVETFAEGLVFEQGNQISLKCSASSTLLPQIRWFLDGQSIDGYAPRRLTMGDFVKSSGHVVSFVNITNAKVIDGGQYQCMASNSAGTINYSARINVIGPASLRANWLSTASATGSNSSPTKTSSSLSDYTITVISGRSVTLICPVIAYPIESLIWQHRSAILPSNHRHQIEAIIGGMGGKLTIQNVHRDNDQGDYECIVKGTDAKPVRGTIRMVVRVAPLIDSQLISATTIANQGMKVKLMCSVLEGDPPLRIKWFRHENDGHIEPNNNGVLQPVTTNHAMGISVQEDEDYSLLTFRSVSIRHVGNWTCRAWNDVQSVNRTTYLIVNVAPSWLTEPKNSQVVLGNNIIIDCNAQGNPKPRVLWKKSTAISGSTTNGLDDYSGVNDQSIDQSSSSTKNDIDQHPSEYRELLSTYRRQVYPNGTLFIQEVDKSDAGFYMCQVSNGIGAGLSKVIHLIVQSPPYFATKFLSKSVSKGETALLECQVQGDPVLHIHWYKDRALIHSSSNMAITESPSPPPPATMNDSNHLTTMMHTFHDTRYTIKQDVISSQKVISFLQIINVDRQDSTIYTCIASNDFGTDNTSVQLIVQEVPDAPPGVEIVEVSSRSIQLQWKSPYSGNSPLIRFHVQYRRVNCSYMKHEPESFWNEMSTHSGTELRITVKGLMPNCYYEVKVSSENQIGRSEQSTNSIVTKTLEEVPGGPPTDVQVETTSSTSLKIKWRPPLRAVQFGRIRGYYIGYKIVGSDEPFQYKNVDVVNDDPNASTISEQSQQVSYITNLKRKTSYVIILQAYNSVGPGPRSDEIKISTFDSQPPTSPLLEVVTTTYDGILIKWDSSFQQSHGHTVDDIEEKEYVLYYRQDEQKSATEWHQKRIYAKSNQFVLNKENSQGRIRCGTKYHLYMTATNSLGTGEPSETVIARTKGDTPIAPSRAEFIVANSTTAILSLKSWQARGCMIQAFTIQYKPVQQKQWIPLVEYLESRDYFYVNHLSPNRDYQLLVSAHSEPGVTRQEYTFHTPNDSAVVRLHSGGGSIGLSASASPMDPYTIDSMHSGHTANIHFRNFTVLLPVLISLMVLIVILATLFGCLRRQHVNHVVNSVDGHGSIRQDLCAEHLARYNGSKEGAITTNTMLVNGRRDSLECYPMTEFHPPANVMATTSCTNSCDSKSNLLNGNINNGDMFATSPRHARIGPYISENGMANFATLKLLQQSKTNGSAIIAEQSYYSSPQRKSLLANINGGNNHLHRSDHEYAEPLQTSGNIVRNGRCSMADLLLVVDSNTTVDNSNSLGLADNDSLAQQLQQQQQQQRQQPLSMQVQLAQTGCTSTNNDHHQSSYSILNKTANTNQEHL
ncbi:cell adhesion molecule Dscam1-like isoform X1 [Dermatophagoides pteronyssinus]|uniref:cell adhesion molecule Dscam1-like isoform X1 n=1 Tax=Dermatophagoides pteronyssinus TaxID=6956 RepID=UPI003F67A141